MTIAPILIVALEFIKTGGMDRANFALANYLANQGREVHLVGWRIDKALQGRPNIHFHPAPKILKSATLSFGILDRVGRAWARRISDRGGRVIVNGGNCRFGDVNIVHHVHAADGVFPPAGILRSLKRYWDYKAAVASERRVIRQARLVIVHSRQTARNLVRHLSIESSRIHNIYMGVDGSLFAPANKEQRLYTRASLKLDPGKPYFIFVGGLGDRRKGFDVLFSAWETLVRDGNWTADLLVVGRGVDAAVWRQLAERVGISARMHFLGFVPSLPALLAACDAMVLPSRYEGYSLAVQEALCCGLPALVTASAGIAERYPTELSELLLPNAEDAADLARRMRHCLEHLDDYRRRVRPFGEQLRSRSWDDMAADIVRLIEASCRMTAKKTDETALS